MSKCLTKPYGPPLAAFASHLTLSTNPIMQILSRLREWFDPLFSFSFHESRCGAIYWIWLVFEQFNDNDDIDI